MGVFDNELILPGTITEIVSDYSYGYDTSLFGTTDSVTIMGTAFNGPVGKPVEIYSPEHARYIFGETYDNKTRREATLVAEIQDAWDRGCRTIYAVRLSGKEIYKDFALVPETKLKLRISGIFPSNDNKDIYMVYDNTVGASKVKLYKPAKRATIQEKLEGLVEKEESILVSTLDLNNSYGITRDSRLLELIKLINEHRSNNVLRLSVVDENGNDVSIASKESQALSVGAIFPGAYLIGRDANKGIATTDLTYELVDANGTNKPYETFEGKVFKKLVLNTDITAELPIFGSVAELNTKFNGLVTQASLFDFLSVPGKAGVVFAKNKIDYEEVEISGFELYKRLGSGFAVAAKAEYKDINDKTKGIKVKEAPVSDDNRNQPIRDGIYSMLENLRSDYRLLANGVADQEIVGKIPSRDEFRVARPQEGLALGDLVVVKSIVDATDLTQPKSYTFQLSNVLPTYGQPGDIQGSLDSKVIKRIANVATLADLADAQGKLLPFTDGTLFAVGAAPAFVLNRYSQGEITALTDPVLNADLNDKLFMVGDEAYRAVVAAGITFQVVDGTEFGTNTHVLVDSDGNVAVYKVTPAGTPGDPATFEAIGGLDEIFGDNEDKTLVTVPSEYGEVNAITIKSAALDYTTLEEFVEILNKDAALSKLFVFEVAEDAIAEKDEYVVDLSAGHPTLYAESLAIADKELDYDLSLYIPYKTSDNFARHLAQHCTYTSLKTAPTHGIMGCSKMLDVNLNSVAKKVDAVAGTDLNLYAKKPNGKDMLDRNNLPYPIGRNISVVIGQYTIDQGDGYTYISNGAAGYAGMIAVLPLEQSSTSQPINIPTPMYELTNFQLEKLTQKGFVTFKQSYTKGFVVTDGVTMAPITSSFRRLSVTRIIGAVEEIIRAATEPFIGKQNHIANRNSMQTAIKSAIDKLKGKLIEGFEFKLIVDPAAQKLGIVEIDYAIVPIYEIREVRNRISVKESA